MPVSGGTTLKFSNAFWPQRRNAYRSRLRLNSNSAFKAKARGEPATSTCTEWSITSSTGWSGLIFFGSPPICFMASRIAARSTTAGTPVKSWSKTRLGRNEISRSGSAFGSQPASPRMSSAVTVMPSSCRNRFSSSTLSEKGSRDTSIPWALSASRR